MSTCVRCQKENPAEVRFCGFCGKKQPEAPARASPLPAEGAERWCSECGFRNRAAFRCCVQCGTWLLAAEREDPAAPVLKTETPGSETRGWTFPVRTETPALVHLQPDGGSKRHPIVSSRVLIARDGRDGEGCVNVPDDPFLSTSHAEVALRGGRYWLRDLGSTNGTFVRIRGGQELRPGDEILIGGSIFRFVV